MGDLISPGESLSVQVGKSGEGTSGEERVADVLNGAFDTAFLIAASRTKGESREVIWSAQIEHARVKVNRIAAAFADHAAHIVVENVSWNSAPVTEGVNVPQHQILDALVKEEFYPQRARIRERDDEAGKLTLSSAYADFPEMRPIGLSIFARQRRQAQKGFPFLRA